MNKLITSTSLLSICMLTSCSTIKGYRQDPDTWGKKKSKVKKEEKAKTQEAPTIVDLPRHSPETQFIPSVSIPSDQNAHVNVPEQPKKVAKQGRVVQGMIEPNVTHLPDNKDLQESNNVTPIPLTPKSEAPVVPLLPDSLEPLPDLEPLSNP